MSISRVVRKEESGAGEESRVREESGSRVVVKTVLGTMDYKTIAASLGAIGFNGWVSIEAHDNETDLVPLVDDWLTYLRESWA